MKLLLALLTLAGGGPDDLAPEPVDTLQNIEQVTVVAPAAKQTFSLRQQPISSTVLSPAAIERERVLSVKDLSAVVPNFYQPDYGSRMTSSIYVRGFGARIDQPVVGVNVDEIPYLNKNSYDFDLFDIARIEVLRGPQGTLYGRNTIGGQLNIYTLSPLGYSGVRPRPSTARVIRFGPRLRITGACRTISASRSEDSIPVPTASSTTHTTAATATADTALAGVCVWYGRGLTAGR